MLLPSSVPPRHEDAEFLHSLTRQTHPQQPRLLFDPSFVVLAPLPEPVHRFEFCVTEGGGSCLTPTSQSPLVICFGSSCGEVSCARPFVSGSGVVAPADIVGQIYSVAIVFSSLCLQRSYPRPQLSSSTPLPYAKISAAPLLTTQHPVVSISYQRPRCMCPTLYTSPVFPAPRL